MRGYYLSSAIAFILLTLTSCGGSSGTTATTDGGAPLTSNSSSTVVDGSSCAERLPDGELGIPLLLINMASACDYYLDGELRIKNNVTIEPGTTILASASSKIIIDGGSIQAIGNSNARITLKGEINAKGFWKGLTLFKTRPSRLEFVDIIDAGQQGRLSQFISAGLDVSGSTVGLVNVSVSNSFVNGANFELNTILTDFSNNRFFGNDLAGLTLQPNLVKHLDSASDYLGESSPNGKPVVAIHAEFAPSLVQQEPIRQATWKALNAPYEAIEALRLRDETDQLTLEPGVEIITKEEIWDPISISDGASLIAQGTAENPVVFTASVEDIDGHHMSVGRNASVTLDHVVFNGYDNGVVISGGAVTVSNTEFNVVRGFGIGCIVPDSLSSATNTLSVGENVSASEAATAVIDPDCP